MKNTIQQASKQFTDILPKKTCVQFKSIINKIMYMLNE